MINQKEQTGSQRATKETQIAAKETGGNGDDHADRPPKPKHEPTSKAANDPLRWFGILVPPALRSAQSSFVAAVHDAVPGLVELQGQMRMAEVGISRLRKRIAKVDKGGRG